MKTRRKTARKRDKQHAITVEDEKKVGDMVAFIHVAMSANPPPEGRLLSRGSKSFRQRVLHEDAMFLRAVVATQKSSLALESTIFLYMGAAVAAELGLRVRGV